jgi:hypothetical protein
MGTVIAVTRPGRAGAPRRRRARGPLTPVRTEQRETFVNPVTEPGGRKRLEVWHAASVDGSWSYERVDDHDAGTPWTVTYAPTGQTREGYPLLDDAREDTASGKLGAALRWEALQRAVDPALEVAARAVAQGWLGRYLVEQLVADGQPVEAEARCECGGLLVSLELQGERRWAHLGACDECLTYGSGEWSPDPEVCEHRACGALFPMPAECVHDGCHGEAIPDGGRGCEKDRGECCRCCAD